MTPVTIRVVVVVVIVAFFSAILPLEEAAYDAFATALRLRLLRLRLLLLRMMIAVSVSALSDDAYDVAESPANPPLRSRLTSPAYHCSKSTRNFSRLRSNRACR